MLRRDVLGGLIALPALAAVSGSSSSFARAASTAVDYRGPNVIVIRFGGGVRRRETIIPETSYAPYLARVLAPRGTLFDNMEISNAEGVQTSHAQGTLYLLTGRYDRYDDIEGEFLRERFIPKAPTLFEYLRKDYRVPAHQALIINGEDRGDEDFLTFSASDHHGVAYRSVVLSRPQFETRRLRRLLAGGELAAKPLKSAKAALAALEAEDYRGTARGGDGPEIEAFWARWNRHYGASGLVAPRGDRLLTALALGAIAQLRPKLLLVNYQDPDFVHWGNFNHYTRAISIIDDGIRQLVAAVAADEAYRDNTVFVIVPDCGRDDNPFMAVPCQHHFNSKSAHQIWALLFGPGIAANRLVRDSVEQIAVTQTIAALMGFQATGAEGRALHQALV